MNEKFWDERYAANDFAYGTKANHFFTTQLQTYPVSKILLAADGEGRNAVYAALQGISTSAFDYSEMALQKAAMLANQQQVEIDFRLADALTVQYEADSFDMIALIYAHFPATIRQAVHRHLLHCLKPGGMVILEAFDKSQLGRNSGGPKEESMLYDIEMMEADFAMMDIISLKREEVMLDEGPYHQGLAQVVRLIAKKKK